MDEREVKHTVATSWIYGLVPEGCRLCVRGMKMVYFMGGDCLRPLRCSWYCPLSENRKLTTSHFIDEIPIKEYNSLQKTIDKLVYEAKSINAAGMSITGGDPLSSSFKVDWVCSVIQAMKVERGNQFHIHLYTSGTNFSSLIADKLEIAGLDNIRFHPSESDFNRINLAIGRKYTVAGEVPVIPTEKNHQYLLKLADHLDMSGADFLNLNEFEMCATNRESLQQKGFKLKKNTIASVQGSQKYAKKFIEEYKPKNNLSIHFCSVASKDSVQIRERYLRRAQIIKKPFEDITEAGCFLYLRVKGSVNEISKLYECLKNESQIPDNLLGLNLSGGYLDLPPFLNNNEDFLDLLDQYKIKAGVYEVLPFREKNLSEIREYSPIMNNLRMKK